MITRELEAILAEQTGYPAGEIDARTRPLRDLDLIPHGPRGRHAPRLEPQHAALVILTMVARRPILAKWVAPRAMKLKLVPRPGSGMNAKTTLAETIAGGLSEPENIHRIEVACDGNLAWITFAGDGATVLFCDDDKMAKSIAAGRASYDSAGSSSCGHSFVMRAGAFKAIAAALKADEFEKPADWGPTTSWGD